MCFNSISTLRRKCVTGGIMAGVNKLYMISYKDLSIISGDKPYTVTSNTITSIGVTSVKFVEVGILKTSSVVSDKLIVNISNDSSYYEHSSQLNLSDITDEVVSFIDNLQRQELVIIIKTFNNTYHTIGLDGSLYLVDAEITTGKSPSDLYGATLNLKGTSNNVMRQVDSSIISGIIGTTSTSSFTAYWGWVDTISLSTNSDITSLQGHSDFIPGYSIIADYTSNSSPKYLIMAQPVSEPVKTTWFGSIFNQGTIGLTDDLFASAIVVGSYSVYVSNYKTEQPDTTITFNV